MIYEPQGAIPTPIDVTALWKEGRPLTLWMARSEQDGDKKVTRYRMLNRTRQRGINASENTPQLVLDGDKRGRLRSMTEKSLHCMPTHPYLVDTIRSYEPVDAIPPVIVPECTGVDAAAVNLYLTDQSSAPPSKPASLANKVRLRRAVMAVDHAVTFINGSVADLRDPLADIMDALDLDTTAEEKVADVVAITRKVGAFKHYARAIDLDNLALSHGATVHALATRPQDATVAHLFPCFEALWAAHTVCDIEQDEPGQAPRRFLRVTLDGNPPPETYSALATNIIRTAFELHLASALALIATGGERVLPEYTPYRMALQRLRPTIYQDVTTETAVIGKVAPVLPPTAQRGRNRQVR